MNFSTSRLHIVEISAMLALCVALCFATWGENSSARLSSQLIRLHVIAQSDDATEQAIKLEVRDAVLAYTSPLLEGGDISHAYMTLYENLPQIEQVAISAAYGRDVSVSLTQEEYPTRYYDTFALPTGEYSSLQVKIGDALGQNWWCVVFPPLCTDTSLATQVFANGEITTISSENDDYILRFRAMELWGTLKAKIVN